MSLDYVRENIPLARELRASMTAQERHLWYDGLRHLSVRFQRQKVIGPFIADFYCHRARLVVELDGGQHFTDEAREYDSRRTAYLEAQGVEVMRLRNWTIDHFFNEAVLAIQSKVEERIGSLEEDNQKGGVLPQSPFGRQPSPGGGQ